MIPAEQLTQLSCNSCSGMCLSLHVREGGGRQENTSCEFPDQIISNLVVCNVDIISNLVVCNVDIEKIQDGAAPPLQVVAIHPHTPSVSLDKQSRQMANAASPFE